jgi:hypothetical protein
MGQVVVIEPVGDPNLASGWTSKYRCRCRCGVEFERNGFALRKSKDPKCRKCQEAQRRGLGAYRAPRANTGDLTEDERRQLAEWADSWKADRPTRLEMAALILADRTGFRRLRCHGGGEDF